MTQSIIKIGNSQGIIIPKDILKKLKVKSGDTINMEFEDDNKVVISKKPIIKAKPALSPQLLSWLDGFNKRYKNALVELASK